jgi:CDGSH-type Zn-finger protein
MEDWAAMSVAVAAQEGSFAVQLRAGTTDPWRGCGRSATQRFRDGERDPTSRTPVVFKAAQDGPADPCGCGTSQGRRYCDGSHDRP